VCTVKLRTVVKRAVRRRARARVIVPAKRAVRRKIRAHPLFRCGSCGKSYNSPFGHMCGNRGDFGKRRRAVQRAAAAAERKPKRAAARAKANERVAAARKSERGRAAARVSATRRRERARADARVARAKAAGARPAGRAKPSSHDWRNCRDHDCLRPACEAYREGLADAQDAEQPR
jgi:hypothetical protein